MKVHCLLPFLVQIYSLQHLAVSSPDSLSCFGVNVMFPVIFQFLFLFHCSLFLKLDILLALPRVESPAWRFDLWLRVSWLQLLRSYLHLAQTQSRGLQCFHAQPTTVVQDLSSRFESLSVKCPVLLYCWMPLRWNFSSVHFPSSDWRLHPRFLVTCSEIHQFFPLALI